MNLERRDTMPEATDTGCAVCVDAEKNTIVGRAIAYNSPSKPLKTLNGDSFVEIILPSALDATLSDPANDILAFREHDAAMLLGRRSANTITLENRTDGLYVTISVPDTSYGEDLLELAKRGDIKGFSFGFSNAKAKNYKKDGVNYREISQLDLKEVSVVAMPAYNETTLGLRAEDFADANKDKENESAKNEAANKAAELRNRDLALRFKHIKIYEAQNPRASE